MPSYKQKVILDYLCGEDSITLDKAVELIGRDIYANPYSWVGKVMSRMVNNGMLVRVKPGLFKRPSMDNYQHSPRQLKAKPIDENQQDLFAGAVSE